MKRYKLRVSYALNLLTVRSDFIHAVNRDIVKAHRQYKRLNAPDNRVVVALPTQFQIPFPRFTENATPQPERLILRAVLLELGKPFKNLLNNASLFVVSGD